MKKATLLLILALLLFSMHTQARTLDLEAVGVQPVPSDSYCLATYSDIAYALTFRTREELVAYLRECALLGREGVRFSYGDALAEGVADRNWMTAACSEAGIEEASWTRTPGRNLLEFTRLVYYPEFVEYWEAGTPLPPTLETLDEVEDFIWECQAQGRESAVFYYGVALDLLAMDPLTGDRVVNTVLTSSGVKNRRGCSVEPNLRRVELSGLTYYHNSFRVRTMEEAKAAMAACRADALETATFYFSEELYRHLSAEYFRGLYLLEHKAAMADRKMYPEDLYRRVTYQDIGYATTYFHCATLRDVIGAFTACADALFDPMTLYLTEELYETLTANDLAKLISLRKDCGMGFMKFSTNDARLYVRCHDITYYPGHRVLHAVRNGIAQEMSDRERQLLRTAEVIVSQARARSATALELETALFDAVCENVEYTTTSDSTEKGQRQLEEVDTAVGALLNGAADCDGYADAFYLLGNLAGLEVRYKVGDARTEFIANGVDEAHRWNLIRLGGQWYMVDVTWGDVKDGAPGEYEYQWLNLGADRAVLSHIWDADAAFVPLAVRTDPSLFHFTRNGLQFFNLNDAAAAIYSRGKAGETVVQVMLSGGAYTGGDDFVRSMRENLTCGGEYTHSAQAIGEDWFVRVLWKEIW